MTLYLLPNLLGSSLAAEDFLPQPVFSAMAKIDGLIAENTSEGRRYLKRFQTKKKPEHIPIALIQDDPDFLLEPIVEGERWGVVSDAGLPCLADPGAKLVKRAQEKHIPIEAFVGPSSVTLALIQSGLSGQSFVFHGYIPKGVEERSAALKKWEKMRGYTHIFIEAPFKNSHTFHGCLEVLDPKTQLCVAVNLTHSDQYLQTHSIAKWRDAPPPPLEKKPAIFLFAAY